MAVEVSELWRRSDLNDYVTYKDKKMTLKQLKVTLFTAIACLSLSTSVSVQAAPSYDECLWLQEQCAEGNAGACRTVNGICRRLYGFPVPIPQGNKALREE